MRIVNHTHWRTRHLKTFVSRICDRELVDSSYRKRLIVTFMYGKAMGNGYDDHVTGRAPYHGFSMIIWLPKKEIFKQSLAMVIAHEMAHNQGAKHRNLHTVRYDWVEGWKEEYAWAKALPLEKYQPVQPTQPGPAQKAQGKLANAQVLLKQWETKKKAAINKVQKYKDSVKYYEARVKELS